MEHKIEEWVEAGSEDRKQFRQAVHTILFAIAGSDYLKPKMIIKGGMLLGIRYNSDRFTEDIDFSTSEKYSEINNEVFEKELNDALLIAFDELAYGVKCLVQSLKVQPRKHIENATFPSLKLTVGYAQVSNVKNISRLENKNCTNTVKIDYSFNEVTHKIDDLVLDDEEGILAYGFEDLFAEKLRSMHQQIIRKRSRRQDVYDLYYLIKNTPLPSEEEKMNILGFLINKSQGRLPKEMLHINSLDDEDIRKRSSKDYHLLAHEIGGELPEFEIAYRIVNAFYKSLPWDDYV
jgi:predicted nucleotidyltransferase component of viral defense system